MATPPDFVAGNVLTAAQMNKIGLWLVKTQTIGSGVSSVDVTDAFSADYENYRIIVMGGVGSVAQGINVTMGTSTASYYMNAITPQYGSDTIGYVRTTNGSAWLAAGLSLTTNNGLDIMLYRPFATARTGIQIVGRVDERTNGGSTAGGGFHDVAASYTSFKLTVSGTMTGGTIYVYGYRD